MKVLKIIPVFILFSLAACSKPEVYEFRSIEALTAYLIENLSEGDQEALDIILFPKEIYIENIYRSTGVGSDPYSLSGEDYWDIFIQTRRLPNLHSYMHRYQGKLTGDFEILEIPEGSRAGNYTLYKEIRISFSVSNENGIFEYEDISLLGSVVKHRGRYSLLNVFSD